MPYPRQLSLSADTKARLESYLQDEITRHLAERVDYIEDLKNWARDYWAPSPNAETKTPIKGASRIIIPLTAIGLEAVHARTSMALWGTKPYCTTQFHMLDNDHQRAFTKWLNFGLQYDVKAHNTLENSVLDIEKFGTGVCKPGYIELTKKAVRTNRQGKEEDIIVTTRRGPTLDYTPIANFLMPYSALDPQLAEWCGEVHLETPFYVKQLEDSGFFVPGTMEALRGWHYRTITGQETTRTFRESQERQEHTVPVWPKEIEWFEIWTAFDVDEDGKAEEIVIHWHRGANFIMSVTYNWLNDLRRPYRLGQFMKVEGRWKGIGICKMSEQFQKITTTLHRQRIDAGTIANMRMFKVHRLSNYGPDEPIFPGKMWILDDMTHVEPMQVSEVYSSAFANEQAALLYEQQRVGVNELTSGMPQQGTPGTATDTTLRLQEGAKKYDMELYNIKKFTDSLYLDYVLLTKQFGSKCLDLYVQTHQDEAQLIMNVLSAPTEVLANSVLFEVMTIGSQQNNTVERSNWMQIAQVIRNFADGMMQLAQIGAPQLAAPLAQKLMIASSEAFKQILETFYIRDEEKISILKWLEQTLMQLQQGQNGQVPPSPEPSNGQDGSARFAGLMQDPRIQALMASFQSSGGRGAPPASGIQ